MSKLGSLTW